MQAHLSALKLSRKGLFGISTSFRVIPNPVQIPHYTHPFATQYCYCVRLACVSVPPAYVLSHDQTLFNNYDTSFNNFEVIKVIFRCVYDNFFIKLAVHTFFLKIYNVKKLRF